MSWLVDGFLLVYSALLMSAVALYQYWRKKRWNIRLPVTPNFPNLPGESLLAASAKADEQLAIVLVATSMLPFLYLSLLLNLVARIGEANHILVMGGVLVSTLCAFGLGGYYLWRFVSRMGAYRVGYFGERHVAEVLSPLQREGYLVFHDMPAAKGNRSFNIDHVVIGPTGVFAIETKTRRKTGRSSDPANYSVTFDGNQLIWPWGRETKPVRQAKAQAEWLGSWIETHTGQRLHVLPLLAIPGWWVNSAARGDVVAVNSLAILSFIRNGKKRLCAEEIEAIGRQLDLVCRVDL